MGDTAWKRWERFVCRLLGGERRGPDYKARGGGGKNDCVETPGYSPECKYGKRIGYQLILDACIQAEGAAKSNEIPLAFVKRYGESDEDGLVVMRVSTFKKWFL